MDNYEEFVGTTDLSNHDAQFYLDGVYEETGELAGVFKRVRRGDYGMAVKLDAQIHGIGFVLDKYPQVKADLIKELGDVHWYSTRLLQKMSTDWAYVRKINLEKLKKRTETNTIMGQGDNRENEVFNTGQEITTKRDTI